MISVIHYSVKEQYELSYFFLLAFHTASNSASAPLSGYTLYRFADRSGSARGPGPYVVRVRVRTRSVSVHGPCPSTVPVQVRTRMGLLRIRLILIHYFNTWKYQQS